ncbi:taurine catabolism dioxygenase TauD [Fischerella thermalis CCMEE 5273]|jgi:alpha-ketoglutarate-dependent taurine dioxygenase|uniref:TauD/TfdA family dioxygenase n=2 Tax=Fischerella thermalis TaxID=372787 RepID=UPI0002FF5F91|nr:TauD/TfdA family dioxygenase [Fischerella thermalis]PMB00667.1 taurine catabolism dioxygenase TauD [Fischerella thermalis CCMEE 5328]PMB05989.1 taurine catabolism dioxygenase TauD [Fischerella thermalis CCMEE 5273]PLZ22754.1 taurine catabolism dioxygenase TauD [Fischerella thermalis WC341]PLZ35416.1 taurine catabolism dioxygenase TauD [Fischerella thermalis WC542]PLZ37003.1 taurine catabolism dioxygenase TauD [Fischerella thermalis WC558]
MPSINMQITPITEQFGIIIQGIGDENILNLDIDEVIKLFKSSSLILFRGFETDVDKFKKFTELYSTSFMTYVGGAYSRDSINGDNTVLSVTGHKIACAVPFHGEMYYTKTQPKMMWFYCATPALSDGETTICDGIQVYNELSQTTKELFHSKRLKYIRTYPQEIWPKIYQTNDLAVVEKVCNDNDMLLKVNEAEKSITTEYITSAIVLSRCGHYKVFLNNILPVIEQEAQGRNNSLVRFEDDSPIPENVIDELKEITGRLTQLVAWQKGDILMVDNTRLLHGRRTFSDNQRDIYVRLCNPAFPF